VCVWGGGGSVVENGLAFEYRKAGIVKETWVCVRNRYWRPSREAVELQDPKTKVYIKPIYTHALQSQGTKIVWLKTGTQNDRTD
jgi:hypothetical protein